MSVIIHVASLSGQTLLQVQRDHLGECATVALLETLLSPSMFSNENRKEHDGDNKKQANEEKEVMLISAGVILEDESLLSDLPCQDDNLLIEIQCVAQKCLEFCVYRDNDFQPLFEFFGQKLDLPEKPERDILIRKYISRKAATKMTVADLQTLLFRNHISTQQNVLRDDSNPKEHELSLLKPSDDYHLRFGGRTLVATDKLKNVLSLKDADEVHLGLVVTSINRWLPVEVLDVAPNVRYAAVHPHLAPVLQPPPHLLAQATLAAAQAFMHAAPQHLSGSALAPRSQATLQRADVDAETLSRAELQTLMQQRLRSSLQHNRTVDVQST